MLNRQSPSSNRVLIADDDPVLLDIVQALVESEGYEAVTAQDGRDAYRILHKDADFRAVIFDMVMPHLEGSDLLRQMQTEKRLSRIPVIIMSSSDDLKILAKGIGAGAVAFVPKPFTPDQMRNVLRLITMKNSETPKTPRPPIETKATGERIAKTVRVLMIEDNPGEAIVIESALLKAASKIPQLSSVAVSRAGLLSAGIERILTGDIDIVFLDLSLPDSEGLDTLESILEIDPGVPVVVLTGTEDKWAASQALKLGARDYLVKGQVDERGMTQAVRFAFEVRQMSASFDSVVRLVPNEFVPNPTSRR
jgi:DNA-binding NtrC family response regulator